MAVLEGTTVTSGLAPISDGADGSEHAFHLKGSGFETWGANAVLKGCWDTSAYQGIRFWMRGTASNMRFVLSVVTSDLMPAAEGGHCEQDCDNAYAPWSQPTLLPEWTRHEVSFDDLRLDNRMPGVTQYAFNHDILVVKFIFAKSENPAGAVEFEAWIDQVELF
jgi:hypothetical protein